MSTQATVIGSYDAARRSREAQDQRSRSADSSGDDLMKGRTFIPRMSAESRKLLIEAMQRAKKKRQERLDKKKAEADEITRSSLTAAEEETKDLMRQMSGLPQDRKLTQQSDIKREIYNELSDREIEQRHREIEQADNKLREEKEDEILSKEEDNLSRANARSLRTLSPGVSLAKTLIPVQVAIEKSISPAIKALGRLANGGKIPQYKKRTIKYRR